MFCLLLFFDLCAFICMLKPAWEGLLKVRLRLCTCHMLKKNIVVSDVLLHDSSKSLLVFMANDSPCGNMSIWMILPYAQKCTKQIKIGVAAFQSRCDIWKNIQACSVTKYDAQSNQNHETSIKLHADMYEILFHEHNTNTRGFWHSLGQVLAVDVQSP